MISKKMMKSYSVFHTEQKTEFEKYNFLLVDSLRYSFGRIKVISTLVEREYTSDITRQICFAYQLTNFYMIRGFTERYLLTDYSYFLENHFYFVNVPDYCFKPSLSRIFSVNSSVKIYKGRSTHLFLISSLCTFIIYIKKKIGFVARLFSKYFFEPKVIPNYMSSWVPGIRNQVKLSINKTKVIKQY